MIKINLLMMCEHGLKTYCMACKKQRTKTRRREFDRLRRQAERSADPAKYLSQMREFYKKHPHKKNGWRKEQPEKARPNMVFGAKTVAGMLQAQGGRCAIGQTDITDSFHVDHDHKTKRVRGLLCARCNLGLGHFWDDVEILQAAVFYLQTHTEDDEIPYFSTLCYTMY